MRAPRPCGRSPGRAPRSRPVGTIRPAGPLALAGRASGSGRSRWAGRRGPPGVRHGVANSAISRRGRTNSAGSWSPTGATPSRSPAVTVMNRLSAVSLTVSSTTRPPGRSTRDSSATVPGRSVTCSRISPAATTSAEPEASGKAVTSPLTGAHAALRRLPQAGPAQVDADMPIALAGQMRREQAAAAARVDQHRAGPGRGRDQPGARGGQPVQQLEAAAGPPPLVGEVVVLTRIVTGHRRHVIERGTHPAQPPHCFHVPRARVAQVVPSGAGRRRHRGDDLAGDRRRAPRLGDPRRVPRGRRDPAGGGLGERLAGRRTGPPRGPAGQTDRGGCDLRAYGRVSRVCSPPLPCPCWPCRSASPPTTLLTLATVFALLYDWPLKSTVFSIVPYLVAFGLLPAFVVVALPGPSGAAGLAGRGGRAARRRRALRERAARSRRRRGHRGARPAAPAGRRPAPPSPPRFSCSARRSRWSSGRRGHRRGRAGRPPRRRRGPSSRLVRGPACRGTAGGHVPRGDRGGPDRRPSADLQWPGGVNGRVGARAGSRTSRLSLTPLVSLLGGS